MAVASFRVLDHDSDDIDVLSWVYRRPHGDWSGKPFQTFTFTGGACCIRASAFREAGGFWEPLLYSREEEELALGLLERSWDLCYWPAVTIRHYPTSRRQLDVALRRRIELENGLLVIWRRFPSFAAVPTLVARSISMARRMSRSDSKWASAVWSAIGDAIRRWRVDDLRRNPVSYRALAAYLRRHFSAPLGQVPRK